MWVGAGLLAASYMATDAVGSNSRPCVRGHAARNIGGIRSGYVESTGGSCFPREEGGPGGGVTVRRREGCRLEGRRQEEWSWWAGWLAVRISQSGCRGQLVRVETVKQLAEVEGSRRVRERSQ